MLHCRVLFRLPFGGVSPRSRITAVRGSFGLLSGVQPVGDIANPLGLFWAVWGALLAQRVERASTPQIGTY